MRLVDTVTIVFSNTTPEHDHPCDIVIDRGSFQAVLGPVANDPQRCAIATVRRRKTTSGTELLVTDWRLLEQLPDAAKLPPLHSFAILSTATSETSWAEPLAQRIHLERSQTMLSILLVANHRDHLCVTMCDRGVVSSPTSVRFIGPGLLRLPEPTSHDEPFDSTRASRLRRELRSSRTAGALGRLYERFRGLHLLVIGGGGGGSELVRQICSLNPAYVACMDADHVSAENLNAMPHATDRDAQSRRRKVDVLIQAIHANQPDLRISAIPCSINSAKGIAFLSTNRFDFVLTFVDNPVARLATSWICRTHQMVHVDLGTLVRFNRQGERVMLGDVRLFEPKRGCVACVPRMSDLDEVLYELARPADAMHRGRRRRWNHDRAGSLLPLNAFVVSLAVDMMLAYLNGRIETSHWKRLRWQFGHNPVIRSANVAAADDCRFCGGS